MTTPTTARPYHEVDISSTDFWSRPFVERDHELAKLRKERQLTWHPPLTGKIEYPEDGFWAAVRHEDIAYVSKNHELFSSARGAALPPMPPEPQRQTSFFLAMDPPEHTRYRRIISSAFTPKAVARIREIIEANAREIVDDLVGAGDIDFVDRCAALLPMRTVSDMIGIPKSEREDVRRAGHKAFAGPGPDDGDVDPGAFFLEQLTTLRDAAVRLAQERRNNPTDDLMSSIVHAEVDGHRLTDDEVGSFMFLLSSAGNDTTKQTTSITTWALEQNPDQKRWLREDFDARIDTAIGEFIRYATPVLDFGRVATEEAQIGDVTVQKGDKIGLLYCSGNRDESVFDDPHSFDLSRSPNPHQGFGGGGVHYCLGNQIARTQLRAIFSELFTKVPDLEVTGEPEWIRGNNFVNGIEHLPVRV